MRILPARLFGIPSFLIIVSVLLPATAPAQTIAEQPPGNGSGGNPWNVSTLSHLRWVSETESCWSDDIVITADIDAGETENWNEGAGWEPISDFKGTFDGNDHVIINLMINRPDLKYCGFFGRVDESSVIIQNIGFVNADVTGSKYTGVLAGGLEDRASVTNCFSSGVVKGFDMVGGLIGLINGEGYVDKSFSTCAVYGSRNKDSRVGGFAGANYINGKNESVISNCYSTGSAYGKERIGGFLGNYLTGQINNCYSTGMPLGEDMAGAFIGHYEADDESIVDTCFWDASLVNLPGIGFDETDYNDHIPEYNIVELEGLTTLQMTDTSYFNSWDFDSTWITKKGAAMRPYLKSTRVMIIGELPVVTNQKVKVRAALHNIAAGNLTEAGFVFRSADLSWEEYVEDDSFSGSISAGESSLIKLEFDDVLESGNYYSVQSYAKDENGIRYYGDASFVYIEQEVHDVFIEVLDEMSSTVAGATVTCNGSTSTTDANGIAVFPDIIAGERIPLKIEYSAYPDLLSSFIIEEVDTVIYNLSQNTYSVDFTIVDTAGFALEGVDVTIIGSETKLSNDAGQVSFAGIAEANDIMYELSLNDYVTISEDFNLSENVMKTIEMETRSVLIIVKDDNDSPVENASVTVSEYGTMLTDEEGIVQYSPVSPGTGFDLEIVADSFNVYTGTGVTENESLELNIELVPTMVRFILTDTSGAFIKNADIALAGDTLQTGNWGYIDFTRVTTGEDLAFTADKYGYAMQTGIVNLSNANDTIELIMYRDLFNITIDISDDDGKSLNGAEVILKGIDTLYTNKKGIVEFEYLPNGEYIYEASNGIFHKSISDTVSIIDNDVQVDTSMIALKYTVSFTAADSAGNTIEGVIVTLDGYGFLETDSVGTANFTGVTPEENILYSVNPVGYEYEIGSLTVSDADIADTLYLTGIPYDVTFRVVDKYNGPLPGADLNIGGADTLALTDERGFVIFTGLIGKNEYIVSIDGFNSDTGFVDFDYEKQRIVIILNITGKQNLLSAADIRIYPNPSQDIVYADLNGINGMICVYDITGKQIMEFETSSEIIKLDFSKYNTGLYFIKVIDEKGMLLGYDKIVIQK